MGIDARDHELEDTDSTTAALSAAQAIERIESGLGLDRLQLCQVLLYANVEWIDAWKESGALPPPVESQVRLLNELVTTLEGSMLPQEVAAWMQTQVPALGDKTPLEVATAGNTVKIIAALRRHQEGVPA